jgi:hypothetical protein
LNNLSQSKQINTRQEIKCEANSDSTDDGNPCSIVPKASIGIVRINCNITNFFLSGMNECIGVWALDADFLAREFFKMMVESSGTLYQFVVVGNFSGSRRWRESNPILRYIPVSWPTLLTYVSQMRCTHHQVCENFIFS